MIPTRLEALPLQPEHRALLQQLVAAGPDLRLALVGGALRDLLLHRLHRDPRRGITDLDVAVEAPQSPAHEQLPPAHRLARRLLAQLDGAVAASSCFHAAYGTVELELNPTGSDGLLLDLATARSETYPAPARNPQVRFGRLEDDLARRDFSVNAMALLLEPGGAVQLLDPHGGLADLEARQLRLLHEGSLRDDPTRLLRAARYGARLGFSLEGRSLAQVRSSLAAWPWPWRHGDRPDQAPPALGTRLRMELELLLEREPWPEALALLQHWGGLQLLDPALQADRHWLRRLRWAERAGVPRLVALLAGAADPMASAERLQLPHRQQRLLRAWCELQQGLAGLDPDTSQAWSPASWTEWLEQWPQVADTVPLALAAGLRPRRPLLRWWLRWRHCDAGVRPQELLAQGQAPGPALGQRLRELRLRRIDELERARWPTVGVVIPVYNDWAGLQLCLRALAVQTYPRTHVRVRVVDNGSQDWPAEPVFPLPVEVIHHLQPGSYGARNRAALDWRVDLLAFTDADCQPAPDWLAEGVRALRSIRPSPGLVAGRIDLEARRPDQPSLAEQLDQILGFDQARTVRRAGYGVTANLFVAQSRFQALGGFHRQTRSGGDRDYCQRARAAGLTLVYASRCAVRHPARDWVALVQKQRRIVGGRLSLASGGLLSRLAILWLSVRPLVSECSRVWRAPSLPAGRRWQLLLMVLLLRLYVGYEWLRLQWPGQEPLR